MNCKPGDLAFIVGDDTPAMAAANVGAIVRVLDSDTCDSGEWRAVCEYRSLLVENAWTGEIHYSWIGEELWFRDVFLRPIRDNLGEDETLQWLDVPCVKELANTEKSV